MPEKVRGFAEDGEAVSAFDDQSDERAHRLVVVANEHPGRSGAVRKHSTAHLASGGRRVADQVVERHSLSSELVE